MPRTAPVILLLVLSLATLGSALPPPPPAPVAVHQCAPIPPGLPLPLGPETCVNAYAAPGAPAVGTEVYNRAIVDTGAEGRTSMATLDGRLYTVTPTGAVRSTNGTTWRNETRVPVGPVAPCGPHAVLGTFNGKLYAGTSALSGPGLWRLDGVAWTKVHTFSNQGCHIYTLHALAGLLYVGTSASRLFTYDGTTVRLVLDIGLGTQGAITGLATDTNRMYAATYPTGIWASTPTGGWVRLAGTAWFAAGLGASQDPDGPRVYATRSDTLYLLDAAAATAAAQFSGLALGAVGDVAGKPAFGAAGADGPQLLRWDGVAATVFMEAWAQGAFGALGESTYLGRGGDVARIGMVVDLRPVPAP